MFVFKHGRRAVQSLPLITTTSSPSIRSYASRIAIPFTQPSVPVVESCPAPTCQCRAAPGGLDIEREQSINGSMASYAEQVLISTGRNDWKSKIEDEEEGVLVKRLKGLIGPRGKFSDPYHNVMITNSSFSPTADKKTGSTTASASAYLLPSFKYIPTIPTEPTGVEAFVKAFVLPAELHKSHDVLTAEQKEDLRRVPDRQREFKDVRPVDEILVLICGHGGRDERCGKLGPVLQAEFEEKLQKQNISIQREAPASESEADNRGAPTARVGLISHIGGHKWAGNVIVYIPPSFKGNALAGKGIWYGRVGPENVEGIVAETVVGGRVIKEFFRGGIEQGGKILRL